MNRLRELTKQRQAIWLDYIRRDMLGNGELARLVSEDAVTGVTSNPAIFQKAIGESDLYDGAVELILSERPSISTKDLYERLAIQDIQLAADILSNVFRKTDGADGFVSLEVSPHLAEDTEGTLAEARRLWAAVDRPNLMIKVPATANGIPAIERLIAEGVNVNVTLMFSLAHYEAVAMAYIRGLRRAVDPTGVSSVASFFVSRVDSLIDKKLEACTSGNASELAGKTAIANSKIAYRRFLEIFRGAEFSELARAGARPQRVLWASTSTKNSAYSDVLYVEELTGPETVNTIPPKTLEAFRDHGRVTESLTKGMLEAQNQLDQLRELGIDLDEATEQLQREGLEKFAEPFDKLLASLEAKRETLASAAVVGSS